MSIVLHQQAQVVRCAVRQPTGDSRGPQSGEFDGYRGIAAATIVIYHVLQFVDQPNQLIEATYAFETVDILFVLSGYLLTLSYARAAVDRTPALAAREFLFRRAVRILPLYWIGVAVMWSLRNPTLPGDWRDLVEHLTFTQVFDRQRIFYTVGPLWSMSLEITFYFILVALGPLAVRACSRIDARGIRVSLLVVGCLGVWAISLTWLGVSHLVLRIPYDNWPVYFGPQARLGAFAAGMLLAVARAAGGARPLVAGTWPALLRLLAAGILGAAAYLNRPNSTGQVYFHDIASVGWVLLLASTALGTPGQRWARVFAWRPFTLLGLISYSTYMWHEPILRALSDLGVTTRSVSGLPWSSLAVVVLSLLAGALSYRVIEVPTSKLRLLRTKDGTRRSYYPDLDHP